MYYIYILECEGNFLYTGITTNLERRFSEHKNGDVKGAKFTKAHKPIKIAFSTQVRSRSEASKLEYKIKHLSRIQKLSLIAGELSL